MIPNKWYKWYTNDFKFSLVWNLYNVLYLELILVNVVFIFWKIEAFNRNDILPLLLVLE